MYIHDFIAYYWSLNNYKTTKTTLLFNIDVNLAWGQERLEVQIIQKRKHRYNF